MRKTIDETVHFEEDGFSGDEYISSNDDMGFTALLVTVNGKHKRTVVSNTRVYLVQSGAGKFTIDTVVYDATKDMLFVIEPGSEYEYEGEMTLFEFNILNKTTSH